jgi:hypothetical protein
LGLVIEPFFEDMDPGFVNKLLGNLLPFEVNPELS